MKPPAKVYTMSPRAYPRSLPELTYAGYDDALRVNTKGFIYISGVAQVYVTQALAGMHVGVDEQSDGRWLLTFMKLDLGHYDPKTNRVSPLLPPPPTT